MEPLLGNISSLYGTSSGEWDRSGLPYMKHVYSKKNRQYVGNPKQKENITLN